jgi:hypothetical protein
MVMDLVAADSWGGSRVPAGERCMVADPTRSTAGGDGDSNGARAGCTAGGAFEGYEVWWRSLTPDDAVSLQQRFTRVL